jgi:hypothetical protein
VNSRLLNERPQVIATVIAHELTHALQFTQRAPDRLNCIAAEVEAFANEAVVWAELWRQRGQSPPNGTARERGYNDLVRLWTVLGEPGLYKMVVDEPAYQEQCHLIR